MTLLFDDAPSGGLGHRRRMEALSMALRDLGASCVLSSLRSLQGAVASRVVVIDSYLERADDVRFGAPVVAAIDDLRRNLAIDIVIDPCPGADRTEHSAAAVVLPGPGYAVLDPSLRSIVPKPITTDVERVLVATGGSDPAGLGYSLAGALVASLGSQHRVHLAIGPSTPVRELPGVQIVRRANGLGIDLAGSDVVVTAGGVTLLEAMSLGRPVVALVLYENQRRQTEGAARLDAAVLAQAPEVPQKVDDLLRSTKSRQALSSRARALVDGHGAHRVAEAVLGRA